MKENDIKFTVLGNPETGTVFIKDKERYILPEKRLQSEMAFKSGMNFVGKPINWKLTGSFGNIIPENKLYLPYHNNAVRSAEAGSSAAAVQNAEK